MSSVNLRDELRSKDLLPHQVEFIEVSLNATPHGRVVLADDVGLARPGRRLRSSGPWEHAVGTRLGRS